MKLIATIMESSLGSSPSDKPIFKITAIKKSRAETSHDALQSSIDKWKLIASLIRGGFKVSDGGPESCGLCVKYWNGGLCKGCPVFAKTGHTGCGNSPYDRWIHDKSAENADLEVRFLEKLIMPKSVKA